MARKAIYKITQNGKNYFSLGFAASESGYHRERIRQFINEGKLSGKRIGTVWFIEEHVLNRFLKSQKSIETETNKLYRDEPVSSTRSFVSGVLATAVFAYLIFSNAASVSAYFAD